MKEAYIPKICQSHRNDYIWNTLGERGEGIWIHGKKKYDVYWQTYKRFRTQVWEGYTLRI